MIFIDSDAFIGLSVEVDVHNKKAIALLNNIINRQEPLVTSWDVVDEVATKLSYSINKKIALKFLDRMLSNVPAIRIEYPNALLFPLVFSLFRKQSSKNVSLTDCTNMVIAKHLGIKTIFSFDHHYEQNGFTLLS